MGIKYENGKFEFDDDFKKILNIVAEMMEDQFNQAKFQVNYIINNNIRDRKKIEQTLDLLFDFLDNDEALLLYRKLCRHYWEIDKNATVDYINMYVEEYDPEHKKFGNNKTNYEKNHDEL